MVFFTIFFGADIVPDELIGRAHVVGVPLAVEVDLHTSRHGLDGFFQFCMCLGAHHLGAAVRHNWTYRGIEQDCCNFKAIFIHAFVAIPIFMGKLIRQCPIVMNIEIADPAQRGLIIGEGRSQCGLNFFFFLKISSSISLIAFFHFGITRWAFEGIPGIVLKKHDRRIVLIPIPGRVGFKSRIVGPDPGLAINDDLRSQGLSDFGQCLPIYLASQVNPESVDSKFFDPVLALINEPTLYHRAILGFYLVSVFANQFQIICPVIILLIQDRPMKMVRVLVHVFSGVIRDDVDDYRDVFLVKCLDEVSELITLSPGLGISLAVS